MPNPDTSKIKAKVSTTQGSNYTPAENPDGSRSTDYFYMFTGGYTFDSSTNQPGPPAASEDSGPAGEVELNDGRPGFSITVDDGTSSGFKICGWNLGSGQGLSHVTFNPPPDTDIEPPRSTLAITATGLGNDESGNYDGYFVTLKNAAGIVIKLDPRIYDM
jgi:hypothetical protein